MTTVRCVEESYLQIKKDRKRDCYKKHNKINTQYKGHMGVFFSDKFSLLHLATGIIAYYWSIALFHWFIIHALYEIIENTTWGMKIIRNITLWPGGKSKPDTITNQFGVN